MKKNESKPNEYKSYLNEMSMNDHYLYSSPGYHDPDGFPEEYNYAFYKTFCEGLKFHFEDLIKHKEIDLKDDIKFETNSFPIKRTNMGIFIKAKELELQLKSDQFGFSANVGHNKVYPYQAYFDLMIKNKKEDEAKEKIFGEDGWINKTRQPGGSFLWPIEKNVLSFNPEYNKSRGGHLLYEKGDKSYYIQDRVDLTLYEIKEVYDEIIEKNIKPKIMKGNKLSNFLEKDKKETNLYLFLKIFKSFDVFTKVFGFYGNFVTKDLKIVNILPFNNDKEDKEYLDKDYVTKARNGQKLIRADHTDINGKKIKGNITIKPNKDIDNITVDDMEEMFNKVCKLIEDRRIKLGLEKESD